MLLGPIGSDTELLDHRGGGGGGAGVRVDSTFSSPGPVHPRLAPCLARDADFLRFRRDYHSFRRGYCFGAHGMPSPMKSPPRVGMVVSECADRGGGGGGAAAGAPRARARAARAVPAPCGDDTDRPVAAALACRLHVRRGWRPEPPRTGSRLITCGLDSVVARQGSRVTCNDTGM
jgi:hypothetical protein